VETTLATDHRGIVARNGQLSSAWRREHDVYLAEAGKAEIKLGAGQDIALGANRQGLYAIWSTPAGIEMRLPGAERNTLLASSGAFPAIVATPDGAMLAAWEENGAITVTRF
jgi:hypothetical protein